MTRRFHSTRIGLLLLMTLAAYHSPAQQPISPDVQSHQDTIHRFEAVAQNWRSQASLQIAFVLAVIVFGALITIFQGVNKGWCKPATLVLGACTTVLTAVNTKVFSADYRVFQQSAIDADQMTDQLKTVVRLEGHPNADIDGLEKQFLATVTQFRTLQKSVTLGTGIQGMAGNSNKPTSGFLSSWTATVYAQSAQSAQSRVPSWVSDRPPSDRYSLYYVGEGQDSSITVARQRSFDAAVAQARKELSPGGNTDSNKLSSYVASSSNVERTYFTFDEGKGVYRFYTLLHISADIKKLDFKAPRIENPCTNATIKERTWQRLDLPGGAGTATLALSDLYRISRGKGTSRLYLIDSSSLYRGKSGKFDKKVPPPPPGITQMFRFSEAKDFPSFKMRGTPYNLRITAINHGCLTAGCQSLTVELCLAGN
jgi:hypothetical protein